MKLTLLYKLPGSIFAVGGQLSIHHNIDVATCELFTLAGLEVFRIKEL